VVLGDEDTFEDEDLLDIPILDNTKHFEIFRFEIKNLADLCLAGIAFREFAGPAFVDVVEELKQFRNVQNKPILIAIDQMNFWDMKTIYKYQNKPIASTQLCVPYVTKFISYKKSENFSNSTQGTGNGTQGNGTQGTGNGSQGSHVFYLGATTNYYPISKKELVTYVDSRSSLPLSIHVPCYSHVEYLAACKLYFNTKILDHGLTNQQLLAYRIHVSNNPRLTRRDATRFFMPIYSKYATTAFLNYVNCAGAGAGAAGEVVMVKKDLLMMMLSLLVMPLKQLQQEQQEEEEEQEEERMGHMINWIILMKRISSIFQKVHWKMIMI
jgi:hypothetical protein